LKEKPIVIENGSEVDAVSLKGDRLISGELNLKKPEAAPKKLVSGSNEARQGLESVMAPAEENKLEVEDHLDVTIDSDDNRTASSEKYVVVG